MKVDQQSG